MSGTFQPFNPMAYDPSQSAYSHVPPGRYKLVISSADIRQNGAQTGGGIYFDLKVVDGPEAGSVIQDVVNLWNANAKAVEIAQKRLSAYCHVTGRGNQMLNHPNDLLNLPFMADIKDNELKGRLDPATGIMGAGRTVSQLDKLFDLNGNPPGKQGGSPAAQAPQGMPPQPQQPPQPAPAQPPAQMMPPAVGLPQQAPQQPPAQAWQQPAQAQPQPAPAQTWAQPPAQAQAQPQQPAQPPGGWGPPAAAPGSWGPPQG